MNAEISARNGKKVNIEWGPFRATFPSYQDVCVLPAGPWPQCSSVHWLKVLYLKEAIDEDGAGVDHRQFVHQLHLVLEGHVEHPGTDAPGQEEDVGHSEPVATSGHIKIDSPQAEQLSSQYIGNILLLHL